MVEFTTNIARFDSLSVKIIDGLIEAKLPNGEEVSHKLLPEEITAIKEIAKWIDKT